MSEPLLPTGSCPACRSRWTWTGNAWLVADVHGRASTITTVSGPPVPAPPAPLRRCPNCFARLTGATTTVGKARVEEVESGSATPG